MKSRRSLQFSLLAVLTGGMLLGCGESTGLLNPSFLNFAVGGIVPLVPGDSGFVLVTVNNTTSSPGVNIKFVVTAERQIQVVGADGVLTLQTQRETVRLQTFPENLANQVGVLFECPVSRVGLGELIDFPQTEPALFLGAVPGGAEGFGVPGNVNPLDSAAGNFQCGDTVIFQASSFAGTVGNVLVGSFVLDAAGQPAQVVGPDTFNNVRSVIEEFRALQP